MLALLMVVGGCAGSTAAGIKLLRLAILHKVLMHDIEALRLPPHGVHVPRLDGQAIPERAFRQAVFILLLWIGYVAVGGVVVSWLAPDLRAIDAFSTTFSAIGGFGPSLAPVERILALPALAKAIFMLGMLAGRLEVLPLLVFFNPAAWQR